MNSTDVAKRDLRTELLAAEAAARDRKRKAEGKPAAALTIEDAPAGDQEANKRRKVLEEALDLDKDDEDDEDDNDAADAVKSNGAGPVDNKSVKLFPAFPRSHVPFVSDDDDDDEDSEDDTAELLRELEKIKRERAEDKARQVRQLRKPSPTLALTPLFRTRMQTRRRKQTASWK